MVPALEALGRRIEDVRWILLTHGHIDHVGGAHALWELTGRRAQVVIHEADAPLLRSRRAHVDQYLDGRGAVPATTPTARRSRPQAANAVISGEMEPTVLVRGGETLSLGGDVTVSVHAIPGHTAGSVAYVVDGQDDVFVGDAVQVHGAANGFPGYEDPAAYRSSLRVPARRDPSAAPVPGAPVPHAPTARPTASSSTASRPGRRCRGAWTSRPASTTPRRGCLRRRPAGDGLAVLALRPRRRGARLRGRPHPRAVPVLHDAARLPHDIRPPDRR